MSDRAIERESLTTAGGLGSLWTRVQHEGKIQSPRPLPPIRGKNDS